MPKKRNDAAKMEKKLARQEKRIVAFNLQLSAYIRLIRKVGTIPVLDSNMVNFLQALLDQLVKVTEFDTFQEDSQLERDLRGREVSFSLACTFCHQTGFATGLQLIAHLLGDRHDGISPARRKNRFQQLRVPMMQDLMTFLERERHILSRHHFREALLEPLVDFYFLTKTFLKLTSRYLGALEQLERSPSMAVGRGVDELLGHVINLIEKAQCIESVPHYNALLFQYSIYSVAYTYNGNVFNEISELLKYFSHPTEQRPRPTPGNIFSLPRPPPPPSTGPPAALIPTQMFTGQNLHIMPNAIRTQPPPPLPRPFIQSPAAAAAAAMGRPITNHRTAAEIPPFVTHPPPRMVLFPQPPMPFMMQTPPPPPQQQHHRRMSFNPSTPPPPAAFPPGFLPAMPPLLPPLNEAGTAERPIFNDLLKRFLEDPRLEDLIEAGNALCHFAEASLIPSELVRALNGVVPEGQVVVKCFGAKVSGVGYETDNVNLFVEDGIYPKTQQSIGALFTALLEFFAARSGDWVLQNSKLCGLWTHLKVKNSCENVYCQISFDSEPYCANTRLIQYFTSSYPPCQKLCYFVQEFARLAELNFERNVIVVLAIFYLQMQKALPTVQQLQQNLNQSPNSTLWPSHFNPIPPSDLKLKPIPDSQDIRRIAHGFFHFYGHKLSLPDYVISPYDGQVIPRSDFNPSNEWRLSQQRYRNYLEATSTGKQPERLDVGKPMCVQDLLVLKTNIATKVTADECGKFVRLCRMADEFYANNAM